MKNEIGKLYIELGEEFNFYAPIKEKGNLIFKKVLNPDDIVSWAGGPIAIIDCFGILSDENIKKYFQLGCEVKALGRGHIQRIKEEVRKSKF